MVTAWARTVAPTAMVVDLDVLKRHVAVTHDEDDALLDGYGRAATQLLETICGRGFLTQTYAFTASAWAWRFDLPYAGPLQSITSITYYDTDNVSQTLSGSAYRALTARLPGRVEFDQNATLPSVYAREDAITVTYVVGWTAPDLVPAPLAQAIQLLVGHWYANRETVVVGTIGQELAFTVNALCAPYRVLWSEPC